MTIQTNLIRRDRTYYFRARVPADLAARIGRGELKRSLGTTAVQVARPRAARARTLADDLFLRVRGAPMLTEDEIANLVRRFYATAVEDSVVQRHIADPVEGEGGDVGLDAQIAGRRDLEQRIKHDLARSRFDLVASDAAALLFDLGRTDIVSDGPKDATGRHPTIIHDEVSYLTLCRGMMRALLEATRKAAAEDDGNFAFEPTDPLVAAPQPQPPQPPMTSTGVSGAVQVVSAAPTGPTIGSLVDSFIVQKANGGKVAAKTQMDYRASLTLFLQVVGKDCPITAITPDHVVEFKDLLITCPTNFRKRLGTDSMKEAIALNAVRGKAERLTSLDPKTINEKYLSNIKTFFDWAITNRKIKESPASGVRAEQPKRSAIDERDPFSIDELKIIFSAPLFTGCRSLHFRYEHGPCLIQNHHFWAPLVALFTGCRMNEIGQMTMDDIVNINGSAHFRITNAEDDQKVKTEAGKRWIPIHNQLMAIGFSRYIDGIGSGRMFPEWPIGADGYYSSVFSKSFNRFLDKTGIDSTKKVFHSFRHTFADAIDEVIESRPRNYFMGHETGGVDERYGSRPPKHAWSEAFQRIAYPGLDLDHLRR